MFRQDDNRFDFKRAFVTSFANRLSKRRNVLHKYARTTTREGYGEKVDPARNEVSPITDHYVSPVVFL